MDEAAHTGLRAGFERVARAGYVAALELLRRAPVADRRGSVESLLAALRARAHRAYLGELPPHRPGPESRDALGGRRRARERAHLPPFRDEAFDQPPTDEARASGHECGAHRPHTRAAGVSAGAQRGGREVRAAAAGVR